MSYSKTLQSNSGSVTLVMEEDAARVWLNPYERNIAFDMLLEDRYKRHLLEGLAGGPESNYFLHPYYLATAFGFSIRNEDEHHFTSDDAELAEFLFTKGVPLPLGCRMAFYSRTPEELDVEARREAAEHFFDQGFTVRMENTGDYKGATTFEVYLYIAQQVGTSMADHIAREAHFYPERMLSYGATLARYRKAQVALESASPEEQSTLLSLVTPQFPTPTAGWEIRVRLLADFVSRKTDWRKASAHLRDEGPEIRELMIFIESFFVIRGYSVSQTQPRLILSILLARYGLENLMATFRVFPTIRYLHQDSPYLFMAYVALVDNLAGGGSLDDPIDWVLSQEPSIDQASIFNRKFKEYS